MTLTDLASLGSFVSGVAVLISLLYLALQLRQAERNQRALVQQGRSARLVDMFMHFAEPDVSKVFFKVARGEAPASPNDLVQFNAIFSAQTYSQEDTFLQHKLGLISDDEFAGFRERLRGYYVLPGVRVRWNMTRSHHGREFRAFVDDLMRETANAAPQDMLEAWNAEMARETGKQADAGVGQGNRILL